MLVLVLLPAVLVAWGEFVMFPPAFTVKFPALEIVPALFRLFVALRFRLRLLTRFA